MPPTSISAAPVPRISTVPDRWGSSIISTASTPMMNRYGRIPYRVVRILSFFLEMLSEKYSTTANFAISEGWKVNSSPTPIQRVALLRVCPTPGTSTNASKMMAKNSRGLAKARNRW